MSKNSSAKPYQDNKSVKDIKTFRNKKKGKRQKYVCKQYKNLSEAERLTQYRKNIIKSEKCLVTILKSIFVFV